MNLSDGSVLGHGPPETAQWKRVCIFAKVKTAEITLVILKVQVNRSAVLMLLGRSNVENPVKGGALREQLRNIHSQLKEFKVDDTKCLLDYMDEALVQRMDKVATGQNTVSRKGVQIAAIF